MSIRRAATLFLPVLSFLFAFTSNARADWYWLEGEKPAQSSMNGHPWYAGVKRDMLSGGDFISNFNDGKPGEAIYRFQASAAGDYDFWVRANPVKSRLSYQLNGGKLAEIDVGNQRTEQENIAADSAVDLRFIAWIRVGMVSLKAGVNEIRFRMDSKMHNHGMLDCFVLSSEPFRPQGVVKPDQMAAVARELARQNEGWFVFDPPADPFQPSCGIDLRHLNEDHAGEHGFIQARDGRFVHGDTNQPVRFWAVNGPPHELRGQALERCARTLAKHGVNLVRIHGAVFDAKTGEPDSEKVSHLLEIVQAMKRQGIYTHFSIYFPLWFTPRPGLAWLDGYDGRQHPFAALYFNSQFEQKYREWWTLLLTTKDARTGKALIDEPAVMGVELINEDSYFFWTFTEKNIPDPQLQILERQFGDWAKRKYGSLAQALQAWKGQRVPRDNPPEGRLGLRPLWNMFNEKTTRDQDTAAFLLESQMAFYQRTCDFLHGLRFRGLITCSNWTTASAEILGPLEKYSYTIGDFLDRHGYFSCYHQGQEAAWSIRDGHTYFDRSGLRFDPEQPGKPKSFKHPAMDPHYNGKPSMISETTWNRPNRYRGEAPLYFAVYGALQDSDALVHFALDSAQWDAKPGFLMQPWTLMAPTQMGQFPAAALIFRQQLVQPGDVLAEVQLKIDDLLHLRGTPLPQDAAFDELRQQDVPQGTVIKAGQRVDPLIHLAGRTVVQISKGGGTTRLADLRPLIDHTKQTVTSSTGQLKLDYGKGVLAIDAPGAQGVSGHLQLAGSVRLTDITIESNLELGHIVAVALDGRPLATSQRILLQAMSEEKTSGFRTAANGATKRIESIGKSPWLVRNLQGQVRIHRADADRMQVAALDANGDPMRTVGSAGEIALLPDVIYYLITTSSDAGADAVTVEERATPHPSMRTWTDASGKFRTQAVLLEATDTAVRLKTSSGKSISVPIDRLSPADQEYVRTQRSRR